MNARTFFTCTVEGCEMPRRRRLYCGMHNQRLYRTGELGQAEPQTIRVKGTLADRLWTRTKVMANGCLEYTGGRMKNGYGRIRADEDGIRRVVFAHRLAWTLANGAIPPGLDVLHHCDNPPCCQTDPTEGYPDGHLFLGTNADNVADKMAKGRWRNYYDQDVDTVEDYANGEAS